jgi:hypothetical protein
MLNFATGALPAVPGRIRTLLLALILAVPFVGAVAFYAVRPEPGMDLDSGSYLQWSPARTSVYPLFLDWFEGPLLVPLQLLLFAGAVAWFGHLVQRRFASLLLTGALVLGLVANPYLWQLQGMVMSEALATPLIILLLGCVTGFLSGGSRRMILAASVLAGLAAAARPSCLPLLAAPALAILLSGDLGWPGKLKLLGASAALWLAPLAADRLNSMAVHGDQLTSLAGRHVYAKASLIDAPGIDQAGLSPVERGLTRVMEQDFQPIRDLLATTPPGPVRDALRLHYEVCMQYACNDRPLGVTSVDPKARDDALLKVGLARLRQKPWEFASLTWSEYRGMWQLHPTKHPSIAEAFNRFLAAREPIPFQSELGPAGAAVPKSEQKELFRFNRALFATIGFVTPILMLLLIYLHFSRRRHPLLAAALISLITLQAVLAFCATTGVGIPRYLMAMWPAIVCSFVFAGYYFLRFGWRHAADAGTNAGAGKANPC